MAWRELSGGRVAARLRGGPAGWPGRAGSLVVLRPARSAVMEYPVPAAARCSLRGLGVVGAGAPSAPPGAYCVAAEAFTNAAKHAAASAVDILIERADRVEAVGGTMTLDSPAGAGTVLTVRLPVTAEDHSSERTVVHAEDCVPAEG